ncbi:MAG: hypothetical protein KJZ65_03295 [Phycisphaerales bacterium]|nr:hypothetical protein [Phycisphaerales bacterium]
MRTRLLLMLVLSLSVLVAPATRAQLPQRDDDQIIIVPSFGFDSIMPAERWGPIRFTITSPQRHLVGLLSLTYPQDGSQAFVASMPVTLTAGTPTAIDFAVCLPRSVDRMTLAMQNDRGRPIFTETFRISGSGGPLADLSATFVPPSLVDQRITILSLGIDDLQQAGDLWSRSLFVPSIWSSGPQNEPLEFEQRYRVSTLAPESAFAAWPAYQGLVALVADASSLGRLPERVRRELLHYLQGGGTLILRVDDNSDVWRRWLPASSHWDVLTLDERRPVEVPGGLAARVPPRAKAAGLFTADSLETASSITARAVRLTSRSAQLGFEPLWPIDDQRSLAARGPVGFGTLIVLGYDPAHLSALRSASGAAAGWAATLDAVITHDRSPGGTVWSYQYSSGASIANTQSIAALVDSAVVGGGISVLALVLVVLMLIALAVAIGPFDAIFLKLRGKRHWSWLTASGWITLFSGFMLVFPELQHSDISVLTRSVMTDALLDENANAIVSWKTGLNVAYAGQNGLIGPLDERAGAWWRGVSPLQNWYFDGSKPTLSPLRALQQPLPGPDGARASCLLQLPSQRVWTVRATMDCAPDLPPIVARLERSGSAYTVHLGQADLRITSLRVLAGSQPLEARSARPGQSISLVPYVPFNRDDDPSPTSTAPSQRDSVISALPAGYLADLPGPDERTHAILQMLKAGHYALVAIEYETDHPDLRLIGAERTRCIGAVRLLVPIIDSAPESSP